VRKVLGVLVVAVVGVLLTATTVEASDSLHASGTQRVRGQAVTYSGTTSCRSVYLYSRPGGPRTALNPQRKRVVGGRFTFRKVVRRNATRRNYSVRAHCNNRNGELIGAKRLRVVRYLPVSGGPPVLPQLFLGLGLIEAGGILIAISRRPRFPKKPRPRNLRGPSGARRNGVRVYAD
jgi:hypothetical protein